MIRVGRRTGWGAAGVLIVGAALLLTDRLERQRSESGEASSDREIAAAPAHAEVIRVVDGDTIAVELDGLEESVRYIGIDTPETVKPGAPVDCFGPEASSFNRRLVEGETVRLEFDRELRDRYGRLLAYVYAGGRMVNAELVRRGFARVLEIEPNTAKAETLARLESRADTRGLGLWSQC